MLHPKEFYKFRAKTKILSLKSIPNESFLLRKIAAGDEDAFAKLFADHQQKVSIFVFSIVGSKEITQEIVQDVFIKVWQKREELLAVKKFDAYLFILSKHHTLNCIRKIQREKKRAMDYELLLPHAEEEQLGIEDDDYFKLIEKATSLLPAQQQRVFKLRMEGFRNPEIAAQLMISTDSVKKYHQLALKSVSLFVRTYLSSFALLLMTYII